MPFNARNQDVTYWTASGLASDGFPTFDTPVSVKARWEDRTVLITSPVGGKQLSSNARVFLGVELAEGTAIIEGVSVAATPPAGARTVIRGVTIPSIDSRTSEKAHYLD